MKRSFTGTTALGMVQMETKTKNRGKSSERATSRARGTGKEGKALL